MSISIIIQHNFKRFPNTDVLLFFHTYDLFQIQARPYNY